MAFLIELDLYFNTVYSEILVFEIKVDTYLTTLNISYILLTFYKCTKFHSRCVCEPLFAPFICFLLQSIDELEQGAKLFSVFAQAYTDITLKRIENFSKVKHIVVYFHIWFD